MDQFIQLPQEQKLEAFYHWILEGIWRTPKGLTSAQLELGSLTSNIYFIIWS